MCTDSHILQSIWNLQHKALRIYWLSAWLKVLQIFWATVNTWATVHNVSNAILSHVFFDVCGNFCSCETTSAREYCFPEAWTLPDWAWSTKQYAANLSQAMKPLDEDISKKAKLLIEHAPELCKVVEWHHPWNTWLAAIDCMSCSAIACDTHSIKWNGSYLSKLCKWNFWRGIQCSYIYHSPWSRGPVVLWGVSVQSSHSLSRCNLKMLSKKKSQQKLGFYLLGSRSTPAANEQSTHTCRWLAETVNTKLVIDSCSKRY